MAVRAKTKFNPQYIRDMRVPIMSATTKVPADVCVVDHGGWHFSYIGNNEFVKNKINHTAHAEYKYISEFVDIEKSISVNRGINPNHLELFSTVKLDSYFPKSLTLNLDRWKDYILLDDGCPNMGELITSIYQGQFSIND